MKTTLLCAPPIKGDPYEEDCTGAHNGATLTIECPGNLFIKVKELVTGIGNIYTIYGIWKEQESKRIQIYVDDDGELRLTEESF